MNIRFSRAIRVLSSVLGAVALLAVGWYTYKAFNNSEITLRDLRVTWLVAAFAIHLVLVMVLPFLWIQLLAIVRSSDDRPIHSTDTALHRSYGRSWLARYIPGRVWMVGGRILYGRDAGVSARSVASSTALEAAFSYSALGLLGAAFLAGAWIHWVLIPVLAAVSFACIFAATRIVFSRGDASASNSFIYRKLSVARNWVTGETRPSSRRLAAILLAYWVHAAAQLGFFVVAAISVQGMDASDFMLLAGAWGVGACVGYLSFFSAGGLGVRDGIAFGLVGPALSGPIAATVVAVSRVILVLADLLFVGGTEAIHIVVKRRPRPEHSPDSATDHGSGARVKVIVGEERFEN